MIVLKTADLSKNYGRIKAVQDLNITLESGKIYGLLGPNGSGKTTTLAMILNVIEPSSGTYEWFENKYGQNPRRHIGAILETPNFYPNLNAMDNLQIVRKIKQVKVDEREDILKTVNLYERRKSNFSTYSLGMKQRLAIAAALIGDPQLLIFDEPTNGLDPNGIAEIRNIILKIAEMGKTIFMASHILDEVEKICTDVAILKNGKLLVQGPVGSILEGDRMFEIGVSEEQQSQFEQSLKTYSSIKSIEKKNGIYLITTSPEFNSQSLNKFLFENQIILHHLAERKKRLEEEFLNITK